MPIIDCIFVRSVKVGDVLTARENWKIVHIGPQSITNTDNFDGTVAVVEKQSSGPVDTDQFYVPEEQHILASWDAPRQKFYEQLNALPALQLGDYFVVTHVANDPQSAHPDIAKHDYDPRAARGTEIDRTIEFQAVPCDENGNIIEGHKLRLLFTENSKRNLGGVTLFDSAQVAAPSANNLRARHVA